METQSYRYCGVCGQPLEPGATVCGNCGAAVDGTGESGPATGDQTQAMPAAAGIAIVCSPVGVAPVSAPSTGAPQLPHTVAPGSSGCPHTPQ